MYDGTDCQINTCSGVPKVVSEYISVNDTSICYANCYPLFKTTSEASSSNKKRFITTASQAVTTSELQYQSNGQMQAAIPTGGDQGSVIGDVNVRNCWIQTDLLILTAGYALVDDGSGDEYCCITKGWYVTDGSTPVCYHGCPSIAAYASDGFFYDPDEPGYQGNDVCFY